MKRNAFTLAAASALVALGAQPALSADSPVRLTLDGRPVDRAGGISVKRNGVVFADVVDLTKAFDGLLTFPDRRSVTVTVNGTTVRFRAGTAQAVANDKPITLPAAPFMHNGDLFVPLQQFAAVAGATVAFAENRADIRINANPSAPPQPTSAPSAPGTLPLR